ncbi:hypothetical protein QE152_g1687 [Popillia japonica]|uniref:Uncharacterized protein n=1 Tax=Popillia japonica TaxID=7064 RepID=A0AAW1N256_POPJA
MKRQHHRSKTGLSMSFTVLQKTLPFQTKTGLSMSFTVLQKTLPFQKKEINREDYTVKNGRRDWTEELSSKVHVTSVSGTGFKRIGIVS